MCSERSYRQRSSFLRGKRLLLLLPCVAVLLSIVTVAQAPTNSPNTTATTAEQSASQTAPVTIDGETLFRLRGVSAFPPEERAHRASQAIAALAKDPIYKPGTLQIVQKDGYLVIMAGSRNIVAVTDLDSAQEQLATPLLAQVLVSRIDTAVQDYRRARQPKALLRGAISALAMAIGFGIAVLLFFRFSRFLGRRAQIYRERTKTYRERMSGASSKAPAALDADSLWNSVCNTMRLVRLGIITIGALFVLNAILLMFPWTRSFSNRAIELVLDPLRTVGMEALRSIPDLAFLVVLFFVTRIVLRLAQMFFYALDRDTIKIAAFPSEWAMPTYRLVRILIIVFALVVGYPYLPGSSSEAFKGISLLLGLVFSLGSSGTIANITAGYSLTYRRAYHLGDRVRIGDVVGDVERIRLQVTHLRTLKNEEVIIPNSQILNSNVTNYSSLVKELRLILHTTVGIGYEVSWRQVEALLLMAARRTSDLPDPAPFVLLKELGDFAVVYELNVHCDRPQDQEWLYAELHRNILDVFNENGVQIMTPAYEGDPTSAKIVSKDKWFEGAAELLEGLRKAPAPCGSRAVSKKASS
jgi:small-conductance mechanosensitive channel